MEKQKTPAEIQQELYEQLVNQNAQFMPEVAMPGITIPVNTNER